MLTITNEDNMELMARYPDNYFDLAIVDPPYGLERFKKGGSHVNKHGSEKGQWNNIKPTKEYFNELFRVSKNQIIWGANNFELPTSEYFIIWQKSNAEDFSFAMCEMAWTNCKVPAKVFKHFHVQTEDKNKIHPTQKPVGLIKRAIAVCCPPGGVVLDAFAGSGSTAAAADICKRNWIMIDESKDAWKTMQSRFLGRNDISWIDTVSILENQIEET
jgi:site-specific DNA-methyltransferase (adenine-specific)